ncbi:hypothetical protein OT109_09200 [Phycisphaeraceae bacterium D3-23]
MPDDDTPETPKTDKPAVPEVARGMGESNMIDPTPGWVPFVVVIGLGVVLVFAFALAAILIP